MKNNIEFGVYGESFACDYLKRQGYQILIRNYRCKIGEIDIIADDHGILVFIEVKTRSNVKYGYPEDAVNYYKQNKLKRVAEYYLLSNHYDMQSCRLRFDCIAMIIAALNEQPKYFRHIKNIFS